MSEVAAINLTINAGNAPKTLGEIKTELQQIGTAGESATDKVTQGVGEVTTATVSLKAQLREMKMALATLPEGSAEFRQMAKAAAEVQDKIAMVNNSISSLADNKTNLAFKGLADAGQAAAGAFQATQGAMALFGSESEKVQKAIQNIIAVQGIMNGVQTVNNALQDDAYLGIKLRLALEKVQKASTIAMTAVQKALNAAMLNFPIGLIVLGIGALIAVFVAFKKPIMDVINSFKSLGDVLNFLISPFTSVLKWMGLIEDKEAKVEKQRQDQSKANRARYDERIKQIKKEREEFVKAKDEEIKALELQIDTLDAEGKATEHLRLQVLQAERDKIKANIDSSREILKTKLDLFEAQAALNGKSNEDFGKSIGVDFQASVEGYKTLLKNQEGALQIAENNITRFNREQLEKRNADAKKYSDEKKAELQKSLEEELRIKQEADAREQQMHNDLITQINKLESDYYDSLLTDQQREENAIREKYFALIEQAEQYNEDTSILKEAQEFELAQIEDKYRLEKIEKDDEAREKQEAQDQEDADKARELREKEIADTIETAQQILNITESFNSIANNKEIERIRRKQQAGEKLTKSEIKRLQNQQKVEKAFAIAQIGIDTAKGISGAVAAGAGLPFPANIPAILTGVAAVLAGVAQANKIINAPPIDISSGLTSDSVGGASDILNGTNTNPPNTDPFKTGSTQLTPPTKVYVLEQDITDTQGSVAAIKQQATFG
jgi:hypothetical protein